MAIDFVDSAIFAMLDLYHAKIMRFGHHIRSFPLVFEFAPSTKLEFSTVVKHKITLLEFFSQDATIMNDLCSLFEDPRILKCLIP